MASSTKARCKQFSEREVSLLREIMQTKYPTIRACHTSGGAQGKKKYDSLWAEVTERVNAVGNGPRTVVQVREKWRNMMKKAKSLYAAERASLGKTGGGPALPEIGETSKAIIGICKDYANFSGIEGADLCESEILPDTQNQSNPNCLETARCPDVEYVVVWEEAGDTSTHEMECPAVEPPQNVKNNGEQQIEENQGSCIPAAGRKPPTASQTAATAQQPQCSNKMTLKEAQLQYYIEARENQAAQKECFQKLSVLADLLMKKYC